MTTASAPRVVILAYHKIGISPPDWESWYYVPQPALEQHVQLLVESGWRPVAPEQLLAGLEDPDRLPERTFLITFDDAYRPLRAQVLPWLIENHIAPVVFVPTSYVGGVNEFDRDVQPEEPILDWDDLRSLRSAGVSIQSHGVTHRAFSELSRAERLAELRASKAAIEQHVGGIVNLLSYPYGDPGQHPAPEAEVLRHAGYDAAFGYGGGPFTVPPSNRFLLPRLAMGPDTNLEAELRTPIRSNPASGRP